MYSTRPDSTLNRELISDTLQGSDGLSLKWIDVKLFSVCKIIHPSILGCVFIPRGWETAWAMVGRCSVAVQFSNFFNRKSRTAQIIG